jgi:hypothetical protein
MKPSMLGLLIAAGAFGASTIYLAMQLDEERTRADEVLAQTRTLNARIAELERARADLESLTLSGSEPMMVESASPHEPASASDVEASHASPPPDPSEPAATARPERSEAMQKMMRAQLRANFKRLHGDLGEKLGLSTDDYNKLIDLLVQQQMSMVDRGWEGRLKDLTPEQRTAAWNGQQEKNLAEVTALIGEDKAHAYVAYQETLPARQEVDMLSRQLEANDLELSKTQRSALVTALAEERKRVPAPKLADSYSREEYTKAMAAWQEDYNQRAASRASSILSSDQQSAYTEYQQWTREMRQQFEARRAAREAGGPGTRVRAMPGPPPPP